MKTHSTHHQEHHHGYLAYIFAGLFVLIGTLLLLSSFNIISSCVLRIILSWPSFIILCGVYSMLRRHWLFGFIVIVSGLYFLIPRLGLDLGYISLSHIYWALICMTFGIYLLFRLLYPKSKQKSRRSYHRHRHAHHPHSLMKDWKHTHTTKEGFVYLTGLFSEANHSVGEQHFSGASINTVFANTRLDLRKVQLADSEVIIELHCVFGSVDILVPADWDVLFEIQNIMGDVKDSRIPISQEGNDAKKNLILRGTVVLGNLDIH